MCFENPKQDGPQQEAPELRAIEPVALRRPGGRSQEDDPQKRRAAKPCDRVSCCHRSGNENGAHQHDAQQVAVFEGAEQQPIGQPLVNRPGALTQRIGKRVLPRNPGRRNQAARRQVPPDVGSQDGHARHGHHQDEKRRQGDDVEHAPPYGHAGARSHVRPRRRRPGARRLAVRGVLLLRHRRPTLGQRTGAATSPCNGSAG